MWSVISKVPAGFLLFTTMIFNASLQGSSVREPSLIVLHTRILRATEKLARYHSNWDFLTKCAAMDIVPKGMRIKFGKSALPASTHLSQTTDDALHTASLHILHSCIDTYQALCATERQKLDELKYNMFHRSNFYMYEAIYKTYKSHDTRYRQKLRIRKQKKLCKLMEETDHIDNTNTNTTERRKNRRFKRKHRSTTTCSNSSLSDNTIVNISSLILTEEQLSVLSKGPKFCPMPQSLDKEGLLKDVREGCRRIRLKEMYFDQDAEPTPPPRFYKTTGYEPPTGRDRGLDTFCDILMTKAEQFYDNNKKPDNLTLKERLALKELKTLVCNRTIRISPADKGGAIVIQDTADYIIEADRQLQNSTFYEKLDKDPTVTIAKQSNKIIDHLHNQKHIDEQTYRWALTDTREVRTHRYHHLPKIHKQLTNPPGRPIISGIQGPTEKLSKLVDSWLQNHVTNLPSYIKDTTHMLQIIQEWNSKYGPFTNITLVTIDVISLYTNIPHKDTITALEHFLDTQHSDDIPPTKHVTQAVQHILSNNVFSFEGQTYRQIKGTAMGTPMAPAVANLFMGHLEEKIHNTSPVPFSPDLWKRFIDDIFILWLGSDTDLQTFTQFLNTIHPSIKFTVQTSTTQIAFLDILIKLQDNFLHTDLFTKPTDAHNYLHFSSSHPAHVKNNLPFSQFLRLRRLCSRDEDFRVRCSEMSKYLEDRAYPKNLIDKALQRINKIPRSQTLQYKEKENTERTPFVITHNPHNPPFRHWFQTYLPFLHGSTRLKKAIPEPPILAERNGRSLKSLIMPTTLPQPTDPRNSPGSFHCEKAKCVICSEHLIQTNIFHSTVTSERFTIRNYMTCETSNIIYLLFCSKCTDSPQYIGETKNTLKQRFYLHRSNINKNTGTLITQHFNRPDHSITDMKCLPIEKLFSDSYQLRIKRETFWMNKLKTVYPEGFNSVSQGK